MNFKNEKAKLYLFGKIFIGLLIIIFGFVYFVNISNRELTARILGIQQILLILLMILLGTQESNI
ncbi:hypothetical protein GOQ29_00610 [Clostridium sp. D2Q-14]|uniref:hypothetical protein n=1 Tax=Anaeromonas gelatinilytica TaxID=2683194 RepID=UPI00193B176D|nr:hypothetical protein [Anaeromonas gelatinilytica]MBS4534112.1 hypothetical protein [Anaeromonas gelatinilytica]